MTVSEFMFLAFGLVLGVASGAALIEIIRARPPARREVRLTVAQDAIPRRRPTTLADDAFIAVGPEPARGGPADRRGDLGEVPDRTPDRRTHVLDHGSPVSPGGAQPSPAMPVAASGANGRVVGVPISTGSDPMLGALRAAGRDATRPGSEGATAVRAPGAQAAAAAHPAASATAPTAVGLLDPPADATARGPTIAPSYTGPCADERRLADERCELATRARAQAVAAADALRRAKRAYDTHTSAAEAAAEAANPRAVRTRKEDAQRAFRAASRAATSPDAVEAAARTWLQEINRINREAAGASLTAERERELAASTGARLERLGIEADAARVGADMAEAACVAARTAVAECDERIAAGASAPRTSPPPPPVEPELSDRDEDEALGAALQGGTAPLIFRLLRGDPAAMETIVTGLAGGDQEEQRRWKLALAGLLDAILADAIGQAYLRFPHEHAFWGPYTQQQNRDITRALASLGYRFDGLGGWVDERTPSQRELSLALGYAGLDPMRMRVWPSEAQTAGLFADVEVAGDEYLADVAGDLTLAEMIEMLGRRADGLVDLWNHWGRIRPLLLKEA